MSKYKQAYDGEWITPVRTNYRMACCDCGLVHSIDFRIYKKNIQLRPVRNNRATGQIRRWRKINIEKI